MLMLVRVLVQCRNMAKDEEIVSECVSEDALQVATSLLTRSLTHSHLLLVFLWPCSLHQLHPVEDKCRRDGKSRQPYIASLLVADGRIYL
jgi:hypothetical protein